MRTCCIWVPAALLLVGCGYTSEYVPPQDGRARPVWRDNNVILAPPPGVSAACWQAVLDLTRTNVVRQPRELGTVRRHRERFWTPRYYGPPIVVITPGVAPLLPRPPLFVPLLPPPILRPGLGLAAPLAMPGLHLSSGGQDPGRALVVLAALALLVLPAVDVALAVAPAESPTRSSQAIDQTNALNDLMRSPGNPCSYPYLDPGGAS
ncbi:MAG: hypothetical protein RMK29_01010 [Myxococcales bacterium]|nr:hypothetical protein [Myxococcota bacterium]MDW8280257.1 hypothetical protein [Myxococcales bacterium]